MNLLLLKIGQSLHDKANNCDIIIKKLEHGFFSDDVQVFVEESPEPIVTGKRTWDFNINDRPWFEFEENKTICGDIHPLSEEAAQIALRNIEDGNTNLRNSLKLSQSEFKNSFFPEPQKKHTEWSPAPEDWVSPEEKAQVLFNKMDKALESVDTHHSLDSYIKELLIISINEIILSCPTEPSNDTDFEYQLKGAKRYWEQVKEELKNKPIS